MPEDLTKFKAKRMFSPFPPYEPWVKERVPLLHAFTFALLRAQRQRATGNPFLYLLHRLLPERRLYAAECGVYTGAGLRACRDLAEHYRVPVTFYGLDTFSGLPNLSVMDKSLAVEDAVYLTRRMFTDTSIDQVKESLGVPGRRAWDVRLFPGLFEDVLPTLPERKYFFVNLDCDLYDGHIQCLSYFYPRMQPGGMIFFDDYHSGDYPMARKAIDEFLADKPETLCHLRYGEDEVNHTKCFLLKL